jgi:pimeloyl-ACP methyl ester carboxylesterase
VTRLLALLVLMLPACSLILARRAASDLPERVDAGGRLVRTRIRGDGSPTVLFEIGLMGPLEEWALVQSDIARIARTVSYDRLASDRRTGALTGRQVARELHAALADAHVPPPYILVGQSFAGVYNRIFAAEYPDEVAGIVLLDPSQEQFIEWMEIWYPDYGLSTFRRDRWPEAAGIEATLEELRSMPPLPDVPIVVGTGTRRGGGRVREGVLPVWTAMHGEWVRTQPHGRHVLAEKSGHAIQIDEPDLVVSLIREVIDQARARRGNSSKTPTFSKYLTPCSSGVGFPGGS